ncbi:MAG: hypothetical protein V4720_06165 [Pseudomonadota bacterium]
MNYAPRNRVWSAAAITTPCVALAAVRDHLRITAVGEEPELTAKLLAAQTRIEKFTGRLLTRREATLRLPGLPSGSCPVALPGGEVGALTSVTVDGVLLAGVQAFGDNPAVAIPATDWPSVTGTVYPVTFVYQAGFLACPADLAMAVMLLAADFYTWRADSDEASLAEIPNSARELMKPWRIQPT